MQQSVKSGGMRGLQDLLRAARGGLPRRVIADRASGVDGAPIIDEWDVRKLESQLQAPPRDGDLFRYLVAGYGVPLARALEVMGYWPEVPATESGTEASTESPVEALTRAAAEAGLAVRLVDVRGQRVTLELETP